MRKFACPHCGNEDRKLIHDNGERTSSLDLTLLCVARVLPADGSFEVKDYRPDDYDTDGKVPCGMQWDANR